jgi:hypothetical protein
LSLRAQRAARAMPTRSPVMSAERNTGASPVDCGSYPGTRARCAHGKHPTPSTPPPAFTAGDAATLRGLPAVFATFSRVTYAGESIGTAVRVATFGDGTGDIVLTARHCIEEDGACLDGLSAFGSALLFVAARADLDVAVFRGRRGPGLWLLQRTLLPGEWLAVASFGTVAVDQALAADDASPPPGGSRGSAVGSIRILARYTRVQLCCLAPFGRVGVSVRV